MYQLTFVTSTDWLDVCRHTITGKRFRVSSHGHQLSHIVVILSKDINNDQVDVDVQSHDLAILKMISTLCWIFSKILFFYHWTVGDLTCSAVHQYDLQLPRLCLFSMSKFRLLLSFKLFFVCFFAAQTWQVFNFTEYKFRAVLLLTLEKNISSTFVLHQKTCGYFQVFNTWILLFIPR